MTQAKYSGAFPPGQNPQNSKLQLKIQIHFIFEFKVRVEMYFIEIIVNFIFLRECFGLLIA